MEELLKQLLIIVLITSLGFTAHKTGILGDNARDGLSALTVKIALPFMVFTVVIRSAKREALFEGLPLLLFSLCVILVLILAGWLLSQLLRMKGKLRTLYIAMFFCDNAGFLGLPLCLSVFAGDNVAIFGVTMYFIVDIMLVWTLGYYFATGGSDGGRFEPKRMLSPASIALCAGIIWVILGLPTENFLLNGLAGLGDCAKYLALVYIGFAMTDLKPKEAILNPRIYLIVIVRMLIMPVVTYSVAMALGLMTEGQARGIALITGMPIMSSFPILAHAGHNNEDFALQATLFTMFVSPLTIAVAFWLMDLTPW